MTTNKTPHPNLPWKAPGEATSPKGLTALSHNLSLVGHSPESPFDAIRQTDEDGREFWSARNLMPLLGYDRWENFSQAVDRAKVSAEVQRQATGDLFRGVTKKGAGRPFEDVELARFACYLVAMNGDPRKAEVAAAQSYFAIKTREAETSYDITTSKGRRSLALAVLQAEEALEQANERIAELEPVAAIAVNLLDATGDWSVGHAAKILTRDPSIDTGRDRLFQTMRELGWIFRSGSLGRKSWEAKQAAIAAGLVAELPRSHAHPKTGVEVIDAPQVRVTAKGIKKLHQHLGGSLPLRLDVAL